MKPNKGFRADLPDGMRIGQRYLLRFDDPRVEAAAYQGRLQDMSRSGLLCFDAPFDLRPPKGTPVTVRSIQTPGQTACAFSSAIRGRGRLRGRLPVLLVDPPERMESSQSRSAHRIDVCFQGEASWRAAPRCPLRRARAVVTNLSGGGARIFLREQPEAEYLELTIDVPEAYVEETARRSLPRAGLTPRRMSLRANPLFEACERVEQRFQGIRARVAGCRVHSRDERGPVYAVSLAFCEAQEACFQLVRFLERQALRKGIRTSAPEAPPAPERAGHRRARPKRPLAAAA